LNHLRREACEQLAALQGSRPAVSASKSFSFGATRRPPREAASSQTYAHILVRTPSQLEAAIECRPASITLDYLELYGLQSSVDRIRSAGLVPRVASPRILKPSEQRIVHFLRKLDCAVLVRSAGLLQALRELEGVRQEWIGDFSLNAANAISAEILLGLGLSRFTPTHDLNADQIGRVARDSGSGLVEAVAYHHLPVFHTEHCVFCRFLSTGTSYKDCGHPCEKQKVALRDAQGREHPVMADVGCRNTVFGAEAQEASQHLDRWMDAGIRHFRLEFVHETADQARGVTRAFQDFLDGKLSKQELQKRWKRMSPRGVTEGSLFVPSNYMTLPILQ
jgi:U32 family peptidase